MQALHLQTTVDKFIISIDKNIITKDYLFRLMDRLSVEYLAQKINFNEDVIDLGEEIKKDWWDKNKDKFLNSDK